MLKEKIKPNNGRTFGRRFLAVLLSLTMIVSYAPVIGNFSHAEETQADTGSVETMETDAANEEAVDAANEEAVDAANEEAADADKEEVTEENAAAIVKLASGDIRYFVSLEEALECANSLSETATVVMTEDATLDSATVNSNVTLLLPYKENGTDNLTNPLGTSYGKVPAWNNEAENLNYTLTVTGTLTVNGELKVGGATGVNTQDAPQGMTTGSYSQIIVKNGAAIEVSGVMTTYGLVKGEGVVNVNVSGVLQEPLLVGDFLGGSITLEIYKDYIPFQRYGLNNVQCDATINYGGKLHGLARLYAMDQQIDAGGLYLISDGSSSPLFKLHEGASATLSYSPDNGIDPKIGKNKITIRGGATFGKMTVDLGVFGSLDAEDKFTPIPYSFDVEILDGEYSLGEGVNFKVLPGSTTEVGEGATFNIVDGSKMIGYDGLYTDVITSQYQAYPNADKLHAAGFTASAQLVVKDGGVVNVERGGLLAGLIQTANSEGNTTPSVINTQQGAILGVENHEDGVETSTKTNLTYFDIKARYWNGKEFVEMADCSASGHTYEAYVGPADITDGYLEGYAYKAKDFTTGELTDGYVDYGTSEHKKGAWNLYDITYSKTGEGYETVVTESDSDVVLDETGEVVEKGTSLKVTVFLKDGYSVVGETVPVVKSSGVTAEYDAEASEGNGTTFTYIINSVTSDQDIKVSGIKDITVPTGSVKVKNQTWFNEFIETIKEWLHLVEKPDVFITAADTGAGIDKVSYMISDTGVYKDILEATHDEQQWVELTMSENSEGQLEGSFNFEDVVGSEYHKNFVVYVAITDKAGNLNYISSDGLAYDIAKPVISIDGTAVTENGQSVVEDGKIYHNVKEAALKVKITDENLDYVRVDTIDVDGNVIIGEKQYDTGGNIELAATDDLKTSYRVYAVDKAGNEAVTGTFYYINRHIVKFVDYDGSVLKAERKFRHGHQLTAAQIPEDPEQQDDYIEYMFKGWRSSADGNIYSGTEMPEVTADVVYTAEYDLTGYRVLISEPDAGYNIIGDEYVRADSNGEFIYKFDIEDIDKDAVCGFDVSIKSIDGETVIIPDSEISSDEKTISYTVKVPEKSVTIAIASYGHKKSDEPVIVPATCEEDGSSTVICENEDCNWSDIEIILALGHDYADVSKAPTCTESGLASGECSRCHEYADDAIIPALGHNWSKEVSENNVTEEPTCTENGHGYAHCTRENCSAVADGSSDINNGVAVILDIPALGHEYSDVFAGLVPTCTEQGYYSYQVCGRECNGIICGHSTKIVREATGHTYTSETVEPTCEGSGFDFHFCTECGHSYVDNETVALGHIESTVKGHSATCTEDGLTDGLVCTRSGCEKTLVEQEVIPATGHSEVAIPGKEATCIEDGLTEGKRCSVCGTVTVEQEVIKHGEHEPGEWIIEKEATCTETGKKSRTCIKCGGNHETETIATLGHDYGEWIITKAATCAAPGEETHYCSRCDSYETRTIEKTEEHVYEKTVVEPTCEAGGYDFYFCTVCGHSYVDKQVEALGHKEETVAGYKATCTEDGLTDGKICSACGEITVKQDVINATGHDYSEEGCVTTTSPACNDKGYTTYTCCNEGCSYSYIDNWVDALGHNEVVDAAVAATCENEGVTEGSHCSVCGEVIIAQEVIAALGHNVVVDEAVEATCTESGLTEGCHCSVCDKVITAQETILAKGHDYDYEGAKTVVEPTCLSIGYTSYTCKVCGESYVPEDSIKAALGHSFEGAEYVYNNDATCEADGTETAFCIHKDCLAEHTRTASGTKLEHSFTSYISNGDATCTEDGTKTALCDRKGCEEKHTIVDEGSKKGHMYSEWAVTRKATCTEAGEESRNCETCGNDLQTREIQAKGHDLVYFDAIQPTCTDTGREAYCYCKNCDYVSEYKAIDKLEHKAVKDDAVAATCTATGLTEGSHCSVCGEVLVAQEVTDKLQHTIVNIEGKAPTCIEGGYTDGKKCSVCGEVTVEPIYQPATGHTHKKLDAVAATCTESGLTEGSKCSVCNKILVAQEEITALGHSYDNGVVTREATAEVPGEKVFTCSECGDTYAEEIPYVGSEEPIIPETNCVYRYSGIDRYDTAMKAADALKDELETEKFSAMIVASGETFADALPGSYLAAEKKAPMLLINSKKASSVRKYILENLSDGGTIYILGGTSAVSESWIKGLSGYEKVRLGGETRYETNLEILKEVGVDDGAEIMVCTGTGFADSLSASATGNPILLVEKSLSSGQKAFIKNIENETYYIIGGTAVVSSSVAKSFKIYGNTARVSGETRYETSVKVAEEFFDVPASAVLAYAENFPDGLSAGPLAYAKGAPLLLTKTGKTSAAARYVKAKNINGGAVLGGTKLINDSSVRYIFGLSNNDDIVVK